MRDQEREWNERDAECFPSGDSFTPTPSLVGLSVCLPAACMKPQA